MSVARSTESAAGNAPGPRPRGRPRREIDLAAVADAAAQLFAEGGYDAVSIEAVAEKLPVSRATLYRAVPTKDHLLGILFERSTKDLHQTAEDLITGTDDPAERLYGLVRLQIDAAVRMHRYMFVFFGGAGLPPDVYARWRTWTHRYEALWVKTVSLAMDANVLEPGDPVVTTRLLLGMCIWVSRWYRPTEQFTADDIAGAALDLIARHAPRR